jgi:hypothetical protein
MSKYECKKEIPEIRSYLSLHKALLVLFIDRPNAI